MSPVYPCFVGTDVLLEKSTNLIPSKQKQKLMEMEKIGTLNGRRSWWSKFFASNEEYREMPKNVNNKPVPLVLEPSPIK